jgi:hypothetical protein
LFRLRSLASPKHLSYTTSYHLIFPTPTTNNFTNNLTNNLTIKQSTVNDTTNSNPPFTLPSTKSLTMADRNQPDVPYDPYISNAAAGGQPSNHKTAALEAVSYIFSSH